MSLFQNPILRKYQNNLNPAEVEKAWKIFGQHFHNPDVQHNIRQSKEEQYQEGFINDLFVKVLGYTKNPAPGFNITTEYKNEKDSKKADGAIIIDSKVLGVIELKGTDTTDFGKIESQAFGYKNNQSQCIYVITSNFEKLRFYVNDAIEFLEFNLFRLSREEFSLLYLCLAYQQIQTGIPEKMKRESLVQEEDVTKQLYKDYSEFKRVLFQDLCEKNPGHDPLDIFKRTQKLLDRFLFLFFAEDRGLIPPYSVRKIVQDWNTLKDLDAYTPLLDRFRQFFGYVNTGYRAKDYEVFGYNGGLFAPDDFLDHITIDDQLLHGYTVKLADYNFESDVDVNILGHIFEHSLNEIDEIKAEIEGTNIDRSKTKRKKDGVYYTPKYITKYIVENTVGQLCEEKKDELGIREEEYISDKRRNNSTIKRLHEQLTTYREWLLGITICDPACGSGGFLNQALEFLIYEHRYIDELQAKLFGDAMVLSDIESSILENNLYGVDINEESVEIAKLSLWLRTARPNRKLNNLNNNLKCGNSLIDDPEIAGDKAFDWRKEFPKVFEKGGFDVVMGNPPYGADFSTKEKNFITQNFQTYQYKFESYLYFFERGIEILKSKGLLSYITPELFLRLDKSYKARRYLLENSTVEELNFFGENVFQDVKVNTVVLTLSKDYRETNIPILKNDQIVNQIKKQNWINSENLIIDFEITNSDNEIINKIIESSFYLEAIGDCIQGITPYDKYTGQEEETIKNRAFHFKEKVDETCGRWLDGKNIERYYYSYGEEWLKYGDWLAAPREPKFFNGQRLLFREIPGSSKRIQCVYTQETLFYGHSITPFLCTNPDFNILYILTISNSTLISWYARRKCSNFSKQTFPKLNPKDIKQLPVKTIPISEQQPFIGKANQMLSLNKELHSVSSKFLSLLSSEFSLEKPGKKLENWYELSFAGLVKELQKQKISLSLSKKSEWMDYFETEKQNVLSIKSEIDRTDKEIDQMVYSLYGLTEEEIALVEKS